jgi:hypothetical protein
LSPLVIYIASTLALANTVTIGEETWRSLRAPEATDEEAPKPMVVDRVVRLEKVGDELHLVSRWWVNVPRPGWFHAQLAGPSVLEPTLSYNGRKLPVRAELAGVWLTRNLTESGVIELRGIVTIGEPTALTLLAPAHGSVQVLAEDLDVLLVGDGSPVLEVKDRFWTAAERLTVALHEPRAAVKNDSLLAKGRIGLGLTVGEAEIAGNAHLEWRITRGQMTEVRFTATGLGSDLAVEGPAVSSWRRQGDQILVVLREPVEGLVAIDLSWSTPVSGDAEDAIPLPTFQLEHTFSTESALQLARDGDLEVLPDLPGWQAVAANQLPVWGQGLVAGTPSAAYTTSARRAQGSLNTLKFTPVSGPATLIDVASYTIAITELGRSLTRAHLSVRNDRGSHLRVVPPPGATLVGVRVANAMVTPVSDGSTGWLVPLTRSVETVEGLLSFSVEVILLGESTDWENRVSRNVLFPVFDAPVAASRVSLHLPPGFDSLMDADDPNVVSAFSEGDGITYGLAANDAKIAEADTLFQEAVSAWVSNDFDAVQENLEALRTMGAENKNMERLQANVDLVLAPVMEKSTSKQNTSGGSGRVAMERRIKEQARARADKDIQRQEVMLEEAEEAFLAGDYDTAEATYNQALDIGGMLEKLEQDEAVETKSQNIAISDRLVSISKKKKEKAKADKVATHFDDFNEDPAALIQFGRDASPGWLEMNETGSGANALEPGLLSGLEDGDLAGVFGADDLNSDLSGGLGGLIGAKGTQIGGGGLGSRGSGLGGGGSAEGLGGLGTKGVGSGRSGYGSGSGSSSSPNRSTIIVDSVTGGVRLSGVGASGSGSGSGHFSAPKKRSTRVQYEERVDIDFGDLDDVSVTGELIKPQGALLLDRKVSNTRSEPMPPMGSAVVVEEAPLLQALGYEEGAATTIDFEDMEMAGELVTPSTAKPAPAAPLSEVVLEASTRRPQKEVRRAPKPIGFGSAKRPPPPPPNAEPQPESIDIFGGGPVKVTATALSVIVPTQGERIRYQHLLLPADTPLSVTVRAKKTRRN